MRFLKPYRGLVAVTLLVLLVDNVGTLLVPTMLANMVNTGITTGDVDYILRNGLYMFIATSMASGGTVLGCYLSARLAANVACDIRNAVYNKSLELGCDCAGGGGLYGCQRGADFYAPTGLYRPHERGAAREYCGRARHPCV